jgi:hypothetical protein
VLKPQEKTPRTRIYVNGLRVAEEDNFLFSYNITSPTAALRRALNRERSNVGRSAYTNRVKDILLACDADQVIDALIADLQNYERGSQHDETQWLDVGLHACRQLNARRQVIILTALELTLAPDFVRRARDDGYQIIVVPESIRAKLRSLRDPLGNPVRDLERYRDEWHKVYKTPWQGDPRVNIQRGKDGSAKAYQVRQVLDAIARLEVERNEEDEEGDDDA